MIYINLLLYVLDSASPEAGMISLMIPITKSLVSMNLARQLLSKVFHEKPGLAYDLSSESNKKHFRYVTYVLVEVFDK